MLAPLALMSCELSSAVMDIYPPLILGPAGVTGQLICDPLCNTLRCIVLPAPFYGKFPCNNFMQLRSDFFVHSLGFISSSYKTLYRSDCEKLLPHFMAALRK